MLSLLFLICLALGTVWSLQAARGTAETLIGLFPVGMFVFFWVAGGVAQVLAGELVGLAVLLGGWFVALLVLVAIGNQFRSRRMKEVINAV